jgi:hypothetical protein
LTRCCAQRQPVHDGIHVFQSFFGVDRGSLVQLPLAQRAVAGFSGLTIGGWHRNLANTVA